MLVELSEMSEFSLFSGSAFIYVYPRRMLIQLEINGPNKKSLNACFINSKQTHSYAFSKSTKMKKPGHRTA